MDQDWNHEVSESFASAPESVRAARRLVTAATAGAGPAGDDAVLLLSELATNAVIHTGSPFEVVVRRRPDRLRIEVADGNRAMARRQRFSLTSGTGRGLGMVDEVADRWGVDERPGGKVVWFELAIPPAGSETSRVAVRRTVDAEAAVEPDLDALLDELGGWDDEERAESRRVAWAA